MKHRIIVSVGILLSMGSIHAAQEDMHKSKDIMYMNDYDIFCDEIDKLAPNAPVFHDCLDARLCSICYKDKLGSLLHQKTRDWDLEGVKEQLSTNGVSFESFDGWGQTPAHTIVNQVNAERLSLGIKILQLFQESRPDLSIMQDVKNRESKSPKDLLNERMQALQKAIERCKKEASLYPGLSNDYTELAQNNDQKLTMLKDFVVQLRELKMLPQ